MLVEKRCSNSLKTRNWAIVLDSSGCLVLEVLRAGHQRHLGDDAGLEDGLGAVLVLQAVLAGERAQVVWPADVLAIGVAHALGAGHRAGVVLADVVDALAVVGAVDPGHAAGAVELAEVGDQRVDRAVEIVIQDQDVGTAFVLRRRRRPASTRVVVAVVGRLALQVGLARASRSGCTRPFGWQTLTSAGMPMAL